MKDIERRTFSDEEVLEAVKLAREVGPKEASRRLGISDRSIGNWMCGRSRRDAVARLSKEAKEQKSATRVDSEPARTKKSTTSESKAQSIQGGRSKKKTARRYTPSERARILEYAGEHGITAASNEFGASRYSIYDWQRKVEAAAKGEGESPTSGPDPKTIEEQRDREILGEWRRNPGLGPSQIRNQLRRRGVKVSTNTARRVMEEEGYRPPKVKREPHDQRFESVRPNHMWHLDFVQRYINRASTFTLILLDDHSRFVVGHGVSDAERADLVIETFEKAVTRHGKPEMVLHDKGSAFWSWRGIARFTALLTELGVDQIEAQHKEWNGKLEVFNANISKELFDVHRFYDVAEMRRRLTAHLHWYNHQRTNHALGGVLVPADRFYGRVEEVMARIEAGAGQSPDLHTIDLRDRALELFKVVQTNGTPEIWLMGRKVLSLG